MSSPQSPLSSALASPRWLSALLGVLCVSVGAALTLRPFTSLAVLVIWIAASMAISGAVELLEARETRDRGTAAVGIGWLVLAVLVLVWVGATITGIAVAAGVAMLVSGSVRIWAGIRAEREDRVTAIISGLASVVFGVLALSWPDVTVLIVAVFFGARTVITGMGLLLQAIRVRTESTPKTRGMGWPARLGRGLRAIAALGLAGLLMAFSFIAHHGAPTVDAFYNAPDRVPSAPGQLLRSEPFSTGLPPTVNAWRILYTTTRDDGRPALASGIVLISKTAPSGPRPVVAWAHGTTGYAQNCAPSLLADPIGSGAMPALDQVIANGWTLVATDYIGLGTSGPHTYMIGQGEGRAVLDAVRAARQLDQVSLSDKTVVWGHSQGGGSALWTGQIAPSYAPDVPLSGVVAMAPASDLIGFTNNLDHMIGGSVFQSFIISAYSATYPDVHFNDYVRPGARAIEEKAAQRCLGEPSTLISIATSLGMTQSILSAPADQGALGARLRENTPTGPITAPLFIAQGDKDQIVLASMQQQYVHTVCASGQKLDYRTYPGLDHIGLVGKDSALISDLISWTQDRFAGKPATVDTCRA